MSFSRGEVVLLPIPFTDLTSRKVRPAVVIGSAIRTGDLFVVPVSSQLQNVDVSLKDWAAAGLNVACGIKAQIATIESRLVLRVVGRLTALDQGALERQLRGWLGLR
jgi:mRNA interferase MazF